MGVGVTDEGDGETHGVLVGVGVLGGVRVGVRTLESTSPEFRLEIRHRASTKKLSQNECTRMIRMGRIRKDGRFAGSILCILSIFVCFAIVS